MTRADRLGAVFPKLVTQKYRALLHIEEGKRETGLHEAKSVRAELRRRGLFGPEQDLLGDLRRLGILLPASEKTPNRQALSS